MRDDRVKESTEGHNRSKEADLAYGYLWWVIDEGEGVYAALGDGGNTIYVNEGKGVVISIASLFDSKNQKRPREATLIRFIHEQVELIF